MNTIKKKEVGKSDLLREDREAASPLVQQLETIYAGLQKSFPEVTGIGLGYRRRHGSVVAEITVKLQVHQKIRRLGRGVKRLPKSVKLSTVALGQTVVVSVPTDIEEPERMISTSGVGGMKVAALASWAGEEGRRMYGVVTAGHGLEQPTVSVELSDGSHTDGHVVAKSELATHGYDVGLVQVNVRPAMLPSISSESFVLASAQELLHLLSSDPRDRSSVEGESWSSPTGETIQALAFFVEWKWQGLPTLKNVVQCRGSIGTFEPGTSGSVWTTKPPRRIALAIQSHGHEPQFSQAEGTHFWSAVEWLKQQPGISSLQIAWSNNSL